MLARSTYVDCLHAVHRDADAVAAARDNAQRLAHLTHKVNEPKYQLTFLHNISENRDVVRQARELGIDLNAPELRVCSRELRTAARQINPITIDRALYDLPLSV